MFAWLRIRYKKLFPEFHCAVIFLFYVGFFLIHTLLVTSTQKDHKYEYNVATVVLFGEVAKLLASVCIHSGKDSFMDLVHQMKSGKNLLFYYLVPAVLYCIYNNLLYVSLAGFDPASYYVLMQFRMVITGVLFQFIFKKQLKKMQWISLIILTIGCIIKQLKLNGSDGLFFEVNIYLFFIFVQMLCSCFAGVYTESILKSRGLGVPIMVQNVFFYIDSIFCNLVLLAYNGQISTFLNYENILPVLNPKVISIIFLTTVIGITVSLFLRYMNSILKIFASACGMIFSAVFSLILFGIPIGLNKMISICFIIVALYLYSSDPVQNQPTKDDVEQAKRRAENKETTIECE